MALCSNNNRQTSHCPLVLKEPLVAGFIFQLNQGVAIRITMSRGAEGRGSFK